MNTPELPSGAYRTLNLDRITTTGDGEQYLREIVRQAARMRARYQDVMGETFQAFQPSQQILQAAGINMQAGSLVHQALDAASINNTLSKLSRSMEENMRLALDGGEVVRQASQDLLKSARVADDLISPSRFLADTFKPTTEALGNLMEEALDFPKVALPRIPIPATEPRDYTAWLLSIEPPATVRKEPQLTRGKAMEVYSELERTLRLVIHLALADHRPDWWTACVPEKARRQAENLWVKYKKQHPERPLHPVNFLPLRVTPKSSRPTRQSSNLSSGMLREMQAPFGSSFLVCAPSWPTPFPSPTRNFY